VKPEKRIITVHNCGKVYVALVHRGPQRVEHIADSTRGLQELLEKIRGSPFFEELRAAWPPRVAAELDLEPLNPETVLTQCWESIQSLIAETCRSLEALLTHHEPYSGAGGD
jgi:hypothetical protein